MVAPQLYKPSPVPPDVDAQQLGEWAEKELSTLYEQVTNFSTIQHNVLHVEPDRVQEGLTAVADGTNWNPGFGKGMYVYYNAAWNRLNDTVSSGGANQALSNLVAVAINTSLLPGVTDSISLGSPTFTWANAYFGANAVLDFNSDVAITHSTNALSFTGASSGYSFDANLLLPASGQIVWNASAKISETSGSLYVQNTGTGGVAKLLGGVPYTDARDYGVSGNGTNQTSALQNAINATPTGGALILPPGLIVLIGSGSACVTIPNPIFIIGSGSGGSGGGTTISADATVPNTRDIIAVAPASSARGFGFSDLQILNNSSARHAIHFQTANGAFVWNVHIDNLFISQTAGGNSIKHTGTGTGLGMGYSTIKRCNLESINITEGADGITISENIIGGLGSNPGIYAKCVAGAGLFVIDHNVITGTAGQIVLDRCFPLITDNYLEQFVNSTQANGAMIDINGADTTNQAKILNNLLSVNGGITGVTNIIRINTAVDTIIDGNRFGLRSGGSNKHILVTANASRTRIGRNNAYFTDDVIDDLILGDSGTETLLDEWWSGDLLFTQTGAGKGLWVRNTDAGASGASLFLDAASSSPTAGDTVGSLYFSGRDNGGATQTYAAVQGVISDTTAGSEDGILYLSTTVAGTFTQRIGLAFGGFYSVTNDAISIGLPGSAFSDVYLGSGGTVNWNSSVLVLSQNTDQLILTGSGVAQSFAVAGPNSGTNGGGLLAVTNGGTTVLSLGNKSAVAGGAYSALPYIFVNGSLTITGGNLIAPGTTTNDNAATGIIGEYVESEIAFGSAISLTTTTAANVTSISLTAGDWNVWGHIDINASVSMSAGFGWISTTSATLPNAPNNGAYAATETATAVFTKPTGMRRLSISGTTTVYLSAEAIFASGTCVAWGGIYARRVR